MCSVTNTIIMTCIIMQHDAIHTYTVSGPASATRADIPHACSCHGLRPHRRRAYTHICMLVHHTYMYIYIYIYTHCRIMSIRSYAAVLRRRGLSTREPPHGQARSTSTSSSIFCLQPKHGCSQPRTPPRKTL